MTESSGSLDLSFTESYSVRVPQTPRKQGLLSPSLFVFLLMFAIGLASPTVPLYAASFGASWTEIGLMGTSWGLTLMLLAVFSGKLSDRIGRKPLLLTSGGLSAAAAWLFMISSTVPQIILVRVVEGVAWALFWPAIEALSTELVESGSAGRAMGTVTAAYGTAFFSGSLAGGFMVESYGFAQMFTSYFGLSVIAALVAMLTIRDIKPHSSHPVSGSGGLRSKGILLAYFLGATYTFGLGIVLALFSVFAKSLGVAIFAIGALFASFWAGRIIGSYAGGHLSDMYGRRVLAVTAMIGCFLGFVLLALATEITLLFMGVAAVGLSIGTAFPVSVALISDNVPQAVRGYAMGIFETTCAAGFMVAAITGGYLADILSPRAPYLLASAVSLMSASVFALPDMPSRVQATK